MIECSICGKEIDFLCESHTIYGDQFDYEIKIKHHDRENTACWSCIKNAIIEKLQSEEILARR